jgi:hypothetical protein
MASKIPNIGIKAKLRLKRVLASLPREISELIIQKIADQIETVEQPTITPFQDQDRVTTCKDTFMQMEVQSNCRVQ